MTSIEQQTTSEILARRARYVSAAVSTPRLVVASAEGARVTDPEGRVFVADLNADRIQVFAPDGVFLGGWGETGHDPGQFAGPRGIVLDGHGGVYVTDSYGERLQKFQLLPPLAPAGAAAP